MRMFEHEATFEEIRKRMKEIRTEEDAWFTKDVNWQTAENFVGGTKSEPFPGQPTTPPEWDYGCD